MRSSFYYAAGPAIKAIFGRPLKPSPVIAIKEM